MNQPVDSTFFDMFWSLLLTSSSIAVFFWLSGIVFFAVWIAYIIRLWLVQTAIFDMRKDVADIRDHLLGYQVEAIAPNRPQVIDDGEVTPITRRKFIDMDKLIDIKSTRKIYLWIAASIPILIIALFILNIIF